MITPEGMTIAEYNAAIALENKVHARITFVLENIVFEDEEFEFNGGIRVSSYMNPDTEMRFGTAFCKECVVNFLRSDKTDNINWTSEFKLEFGVENGDEIEWVTIGYFTGTRPTWNRRNVVELLAYDRMMRFSLKASDFLRNLSYPCTMQDIYDNLCTFVVTENVPGDEISSVMEYEYTEALQFEADLTCRDLLSAIAKANGCYARITNEGKVQMIWFRDHSEDYELTWDDCFDLDLSNLQTKIRFQWRSLENTQWKDVENVQYKYYDNTDEEEIAIKSLSFSWEDGENSILITQPASGTQSSWLIVKGYTVQELTAFTWGELRNSSNADGNRYFIVNNPLLYHSTEASIRTHLQEILNKLYTFNITYIADVNAVGNWLVEAGDIIRLEVERHEKFTKFPVFNHLLTWNGSCTCDYETTGVMTKQDIYL